MFQVRRMDICRKNIGGAVFCRQDTGCPCAAGCRRQRTAVLDCPCRLEWSLGIYQETSLSE